MAAEDGSAPTPCGSKPHVLLLYYSAKIKQSIVVPYLV